MHVVPLICHPSTPCSYVRSVSVRVDALGDGRVVFYYQVEGNIDELELPPQRRSAHTDGLWKHTCFEAFVRAPAARGYFEFNFSPSSEWAVYRFDDYRAGMTAIEPTPAPRIICRRREDRLETDVDVHLPMSDPQHELLLAVAAVLVDHHGNTSYWALAHPAGKPDFHHPDGFVLRLSAEAGEAR